MKRDMRGMRQEQARRGDWALWAMVGLYVAFWAVVALLPAVGR